MQLAIQADIGTPNAPRRSVISPETPTHQAPSATRQFRARFRMQGRVHLTNRDSIGSLEASRRVVVPPEAPACKTATATRRVRGGGRVGATPLEHSLCRNAAEAVRVGGGRGGGISEGCASGCGGETGGRGTGGGGVIDCCCGSEGGGRGHGLESVSGLQVEMGTL